MIARLIWQFRLWLAARTCAWFVKPSLDCYSVAFTTEDARNLLFFLKSTTGERLQSALLAYVQQTDQRAVAVATPHAAGVATGQRNLLATLISLSGHVAPQADESQDRDPQAVPFQRNPLPEPSPEKLENS